MSITVTEQNVWPPRVQIVITDLSPGDGAEIYRIVAGEWTLIRGGGNYNLTDPSLVVIDAEIPFGVPVRYAVYINGVENITDPETYDLPGGHVVLSDAIGGGVAEAIIGAAGDKVYSRDSARFRVAGKNLIVSGPMGQAEGSYELLVTSTANRDGVMWLLEHATQGIVQIRQAGQVGAGGETYDGIDAYLAVDRVTERRWSQDGSDPRRLITIEFAEVDGWAPTLEARGFTYQDMIDYFGGTGTYEDLVDLFAPAGTYLDAMTADWTP